MQAELTPRWYARLKAARTSRLAVRVTDVQQVDYDTITHYEVASGSRVNLWHRVRIKTWANGVDVCCSCEAGSFGTACTHAAAALDFAGLFPPMPADMEPEPVLGADWLKRQLAGG